MFRKTIEYLWWTSRITLCTMPVWKFHTLARSSCQPLLFAPPPLPAVAAIITVFHCNLAAGCSHLLPHTRRRRCTLSHTPLHCTLLHARRIHCPLPHAHWLPAINCNHAPICRRLQLHTRTCLLPHPRRCCCILLHARPLHHCSRHQCHLRRCWCHVHW